MADEKSNSTTIADETQLPHPHLPLRSSHSDSTRRSFSDEENDHPGDPEKLDRPDRDVERGLSLVDTTIDADERPTPAGPGDPNIVDWDGPDDPEKAINWPTRKVISNIAVISSVTFLTPLSSSMIAPGVPNIMRDFKSTNETVASFIVSIYVLGYALGGQIDNRA
jgi:hypothetical protein